MKKFISISTGLLLCAMSAKAGVITATMTNLFNGANTTNVISTLPKNVTSFTFYSSVACTLQLFDAAPSDVLKTNGLAYYSTSSYTYMTNLMVTNTTLQTNGIYVFGSPGSYTTNIVRQTNYFIGISNAPVTVGGFTNYYPAVIAGAAPANVPATQDSLNMNFVRGITAVANTSNTVYVIIYTKD